MRGLEGIAEEITLSIDNSTGEYTRLTRFLPGADTTPFGGKTHTYPEEVFIVSGRLHDAAFGRWLEAGDYASRPPGELHGPFKTDTGCVVLEVSFPTPLTSIGTQRCRKVFRRIRKAREPQGRPQRRRLAENQTGKRQVVIVAREREGRTVTTVAKSEAAGVAFAKKPIAMGSTVHADEASHWDRLAANFPMKRVNHQVEYKAADGACTNQAESFFSRLRRAEIGIHHHAGAMARLLATQGMISRLTHTSALRS